MQKDLTYKNLVEANHRLSAIFKHSVDGIITIDEQGIIESINPAACHLFGYEAAEIIGQNVGQLMPASHRKQHDHYIQRYLSTGEAKIIGIGREVEGQKKEGTIFPMLLAISEVELAGKKIFTAIIHDLSENKKAKEVIQLLNKKLEKKVEKRSEELTHTVDQLLDINKTLEKEIMERQLIEQELKKSKDELQIALQKEYELGDLKTRFITSASHEFRTPLSTILSSADLIDQYTKKESNGKISRHIQRITDAVNGMNNMLYEFLSIKKLEENHIENTPIEFKFITLFNEVLGILKKSVKKEQQIIFHSKNQDDQLFLDRRFLKSILTHLLLNAIKYSPEKSDIHCRHQIINHQFIFEIKDSGIGIPVRDQPNLFTKFHRGSNVSNIQGTGLGLSIVKRYLDLMQGSISFVSEEGKGTTFSISIPLKY